MAEHATRLAEAISALDDELLYIVTGAGVSAASGIPTFRGTEPEAVWRLSDSTLATFETFQRDPVAQWSWYLKRFAAVESAEPNSAHEALAALEAWQIDRGGSFQLVTQNIDTLHEAAGSRRLIKIHGSSDRLRCSRSGCQAAAPSGSVGRQDVDISPFRARPCMETLPRCRLCDAPLRAHVLFFDEYYQDHEDYRFEPALERARRAGAFVFIGTSFSVGITDLLLRIAAENGRAVFSIDPSGAPPAHFPVTHLPFAAEDLLPELVGVLSSPERVGAQENPR